jgi:hypothetical protein
LAKAGNAEAIQILLARCHPKLMRIWKVYREGMYRRCVNTIEALDELASRVVMAIGSFRGETVKEFCGWSGTIFRLRILTHLRINLTPNAPSDVDPIDPRQPRPSVQYRKDLESRAYKEAVRLLSDLDQALIDLRIYRGPLNEKGERDLLSWEAMTKVFQTEKRDLWKRHQKKEPTAHLVEKAFDKAFAKLYRLARRIHKLLEGLPPQPEENPPPPPDDAKPHG